MDSNYLNKLSPEDRKTLITDLWHTQNGKCQIQEDIKECGCGFSHAHTPLLPLIFDIYPNSKTINSFS